MDFDLLHAYHEATPTEDEFDLLQRVRGFVVSLGLYLPPHEVTWYRSAPTLPGGFTWDKRRPIEVQLRVGQPPRELVTVMLHELAHVCDSRDPSMFVDEREQRAERFSQRWAPHVCRALGV